MKKIDSVISLSGADFERLYFRPNLPLVQRGGASTARYTAWSPTYLRDKLGARMVRVNHCKEGVYDFNRQKIEQLAVPFAQALDFFCSDHYDNKAYYLQQSSIAETFPDLIEELETPAWIQSSDYIDKRNLWIGGAGCVTPLHYDSSPNFLIQVWGRKDLTLFAPQDKPYLYPSSKEGGTHLSQVDVDQPDLAAYPLYVKAQPYRCVLEPGDILFLPPGWWHHVRSLDMCISVNYWWHRFDIVAGSGLEYIDVPRVAEVIQSFLDKGFSIDHQVQEGEPILLKAIQLGFVNVVEALLSLGANPNAVSAVYRPGASALTLASLLGHDQMVRLLLRHGAAVPESEWVVVA